MKKIAICVPRDQKLQNSIVKRLKTYADIDGSELYFIHITQLETFAYIVPPTTIPDEKSRTEISNYYQKIMDDMAKNLQVTKPQKFVFFDEFPKDKIVEFLKAHQIDLVVSATRGKHGIEGLFSSSFTEHLMKFSPCDVLTIRNEHSY